MEMKNLAAAAVFLLLVIAACCESPPSRTGGEGSGVSVPSVPTQPASVIRGNLTATKPATTTTKPATQITISEEQKQQLNLLLSKMKASIQTAVNTCIR